MSGSSCGSVVLVDEPTEAVAASGLVRACWPASPVVRRPQLVCAMRPFAVVVVDIDAQHMLKMSAIEDQQPVETLSSHCADEAFCDRVRFRRPYWRLHDPDAFAAEDLVEGAAVLAIAVADQEADACSEKSRPRLRACWVTQAPVGLAVQPASQTRRLPWAMKNSA